VASIFTKIVNREIPSFKIAEDPQFYAFLDINPLHEGHTLVIPKREEDCFFNLEDDEIGNMMIFAKRVAQAIEKVVECERIGMAVLGLEVPHAHIHLVPINGIYDIDFSKPKMKYSTEEFDSLSEKIRSFLI